MTKKKKVGTLSKADRLRQFFKKGRSARAGLEARIDGVNMTCAMQRALLEPLADGCPSCKSSMLVGKWNSAQLMVTCGNTSCAKFHRPLGTVRLGDLQRVI